MKPSAGLTRRAVLCAGFVAGISGRAHAQTTPRLRLSEIGPLIVPSNVRAGGLEDTGAISPDGRVIALRLGETMSLWDAGTRQRLDFDIARPRAPSGLLFNAHKAAAFSEDSRFLAVASRNGLALIDLQTHEPVWARTYPDEAVWEPRTISFRPGRQTLAVTGQGSSTTFIDAHDGRVLLRMRHPESRLLATHAFTRDGARLIAGPDNRGLISVRNGQTGAIVLERSAPPGGWLDVAADQRHVVSTGHLDVVTVWSFPDFEIVRQFQPGMGEAAADMKGALSGPNGEWLVVAAGYAPRLMAFDWRTGELLLDTMVEGGAAPPLVFFPDGRKFLYGDPVRLWTLDLI